MIIVNYQIVILPPLPSLTSRYFMNAVYLLYSNTYPWAIYMLRSKWWIMREKLRHFKFKYQLVKILIVIFAIPWSGCDVNDQY